MNFYQRKAHERLLEQHRDGITTHYQPTPKERGRGLGFTANAKQWGREGARKSGLRGRKP